MEIGVCGLNHLSSSVEFRERVAKRCARVRFPGVILSTCNRTEVYFYAKDLAGCHEDILEMLQDGGGNYEHLLYSYFGEECFVHLARVVSGLDSAIVGETEILGQVKRAYENSGRMCHELHYLFQKCFKIGKEMRTQFHMPAWSLTLHHLIDKLSQGKKMLMIGNSQINRRMHPYLSKRYDITWISKGWEDSMQHLESWADFDLVVSATRASHYLIDSALHATSQTTLFDLSVPRNINPELKGHPLCALYNIDELTQTLQNQPHNPEIPLAEVLLREKVHRATTLFSKSLILSS